MGLTWPCPERVVVDLDRLSEQQRSTAVDVCAVALLLPDLTLRPTVKCNGKQKRSKELRTRSLHGFVAGREIEYDIARDWIFIAVVDLTRAIEDDPPVERADGHR